MLQIPFLLDIGKGLTGGNDTPPSPHQIAGQIINVFLSVLGVIFLILIVYGGYKWMTSGGNQDDIKKAQEIIRNAVIGLLIVLMSFAIAQFVINALTQAEGVLPIEW